MKTTGTAKEPAPLFQLEHQQQKQQQKHEEEEGEEEENSNYDTTSNQAAQQAASEAISISRSTISTTLAQGEQLNHCDNLRIRNEYIMKKSDRLIRGLTWSGWMKNMMSKDIEPPSTNTISMVAHHQNQNSTLGSVREGKGKEEEEKYNSNTSRSNNNHHNDNHNNNERVDEEWEQSFVEESTNELKDVPTQLLNQASLVTNYKSNVLLLNQCQSTTDFETCLDICDTLKSATEQSLLQCQDTSTEEERRGGVGGGGGDEQQGSDSRIINEWKQKLCSKFQKSKELHSILLQEFNSTSNSEHYNQKSSIETYNDYNNHNTNTNTRSSHNHNQDQLFSTSMMTTQNQHSTSTTIHHNNPKYKEQEDHIDILSGNIQELLHNSTSMGMIIDEQNLMLDVLNDGTDDLVESTKMISRKADRLRYRTMWKSPKSDYKCSVLIQHIPTQKYLTIEPHHNNKITLHAQAHSEASVFEVHERRTPNSISDGSGGGGSGSSNGTSEQMNMIGLCNKCTRKWMGQSSIVGSVVCTAKKFGKNEEWELDDGMMDRTKILCASANWGNGGWLNVDEKGGSFSFGGYDVCSKRSSSLWSVIVLPSDT